MKWSISPNTDIMVSFILAGTQRCDNVDATMYVDATLYKRYVTARILL